MARARIGLDRIEVDTRWNERELIKQVPGARWDPHVKVWHAPLTWSTCIILRGVFGDALEVDESLTNWAWKQRTRVDLLLGLRNELDLDHIGGNVVDAPGLYPFQAAGAMFLHIGREVLLGDEMGTGKTVQALAALNHAHIIACTGGESPLPALVICPNSVKSSWASHVNNWVAYDVSPYVVTGGPVARRKILAEAAKDPYAVVIINIEATRTLSRLAPYGSTRLRRCYECDKKNGETTLRPSGCQVHPKELNRIPFKTVIVDEAHRIKDPRSQQTRAAWALAHQSTVMNRWLLTGTPIANHPGDLWSLLHCMSPTAFPTKTHFVDRYCLQSWNAYGGLDIVGINPATRDEFYSLLDPHFRRMLKAVVAPQLPPKVRSMRWVEMTPAQARTYKILEHSLGEVQDDGAVLAATNPLVSRLRRMQLASSSIHIENPDAPIVEWTVTLTEPSPKIDELEVVLEELGDKPVVVCAEQRKLIELAARRLAKHGVSHDLITGTVPEYERERVLREFQAGKIRVLLFTVKAGGVGLTMTAADTIIFLQRSDSMIDNKQAEDRVHRIGSERHETIHVIDIVTKDTVEEEQIASLYTKLLRLDEITRDRAAIAAANGDTSQLDALEAHIMNSRLSDGS